MGQFGGMVQRRLLGLERQVLELAPRTNWGKLLDSLCLGLLTCEIRVITRPTT